MSQAREETDEITMSRQQAKMEAQEMGLNLTKAYNTANDHLLQRLEDLHLHFSQAWKKGAISKNGLPLLVANCWSCDASWSLQKESCQTCGRIRKDWWGCYVSIVIGMGNLLNEGAG